MAATRARKDKQIDKSVVPRSLVYTDLSNEQIYFNPPPASGDYLLKYSDSLTDLEWLDMSTLVFDNIYTADGTLTGNRTLTGDAYRLSFVFDDGAGNQANQTSDSTGIYEYVYTNAGDQESISNVYQGGVYLGYSDYAVLNSTSFQLDNNITLHRFNGSGSQDITFNDSGMFVDDSALNQGMEYVNNHATYFATNPRSIPDVGYVQSLLAGVGTVTGTGVATRVAFWSGTSSLSSNSNLYWDNTNSRLGIGTATPAVSLHVNGRQSDLGLVPVNLGSSAGGYPNVAYNVNYHPSASNTYNYRSTDTAYMISLGGFGRFGINVAASGASGGVIPFIEALTILNGGNVGIGITGPTTKLNVAGLIQTEGTGFSNPTSPTIYLKNNTAVTGRQYGFNSDDNGVFQFFDFTAGSASRLVLNSVGNFGFSGVVSPTAKIHIAAGTTGSSTAPLKFTTSGANLLTVPESGAVEVLGDRIYYTHPTGPTRQTLAYLSDALWTDAGAFTYLTSTTDNVVVGTTTQLNSNYKVQVTGAATYRNASFTTNEANSGFVDIRGGTMTALSGSTHTLAGLNIEGAMVFNTLNQTFSGLRIALTSNATTSQFIYPIDVSFASTGVGTARILNTSGTGGTELGIYGNNGAESIVIKSNGPGGDISGVNFKSNSANASWNLGMQRNGIFSIQTTSTGTVPNTVDSSFFIRDKRTFIGQWVPNFNPSATLHVRGEGATNATYSLQVHNSTGTNAGLVVRDDGSVGMGTVNPAYHLDIVTNRSAVQVTITAPVASAGLFEAQRFTLDTTNLTGASGFGGFLFNRIGTFLGSGNAYFLRLQDSSNDVFLIDKQGEITHTPIGLSGFSSYRYNGANTYAQFGFFRATNAADGVSFRNAFTNDNGTGIGFRFSVTNNSAYTPVSNTAAKVIVIGNGQSPATDVAYVRASGETYIGGNIGAQLTTITAKVHIAAGTATANTAPLKFTSGTNLTTPEAGAIEWDGSRLYATQTSGPTRRTIAYITDIPTISAATGEYIVGTGSGITGSTYYSTSNHVFQASTVTKTVGFSINLGSVGTALFQGFLSAATAQTKTLDITRSTGSGSLDLVQTHSGTGDNCIQLVGNATGDSFDFWSIPSKTYAFGIDTSDSGIFKFTTGMSPSLGTTIMSWDAASNNVGVRLTTAPTAKMHINAGSTAAGTAPLKLTSGALMTATETGAFEFLTDRLYFTQTTSSTRQTLAYLSDISGAINLLPDYYPVANGFNSITSSTVTRTPSVIMYSSDAVRTIGVQLQLPTAVTFFNGTSSLNNSTDVGMFGGNRTLGSGAVSMGLSHSGTGSVQFSFSGNTTGDVFSNYNISSGSSYAFGIDTSDNQIFKFTSGANPSAGTTMLSMRASTGNIGIGTNPGLYKLEVNGNTYIHDTTVGVTHRLLLGNGAVLFDVDDTSGADHLFSQVHIGGAVASISNENITTGYSSYISLTEAQTLFSWNYSTIRMNSSGIEIEDSNMVGMFYNGDYSAAFNSNIRAIPDIGWIRSTNLGNIHPTHIISDVGSTPSAVATVGSGAATVTISGKDNAFHLVFSYNSGAVPNSVTDKITVTLANALPTGIKPVISISNAGDRQAAHLFYVDNTTKTTSTFELKFNTTLAANPAVYELDIIVIGASGL